MTRALGRSYEAPIGFALRVAESREQWLIGWGLFAEPDARYRARVGATSSAVVTDGRAVVPIARSTPTPCTSGAGARWRRLGSRQSCADPSRCAHLFAARVDGCSLAACRHRTGRMGNRADRTSPRCARSPAVHRGWRTRRCLSTPWLQRTLPATRSAPALRRASVRHRARTAGLPTDFGARRVSGCWRSSTDSPWSTSISPAMASFGGTPPAIFGHRSCGIQEILRWSASPPLGSTSARPPQRNSRQAPLPRWTSAADTQVDHLT